MILIPWNVFLLFKPHPLRIAVQGSHFKGSSVQFASLADKASSTHSPAQSKKTRRYPGIQAEQRNGYIWSFSQGLWEWLDSKCNFHEVTEVSVFSHTWRQVHVKFKCYPNKVNHLLKPSKINYYNCPRQNPAGRHPRILRDSPCVYI